MSDPDLTPSEEQVRRLLADARHDEPMPDDVTDRLDRVLADLQGESRRTSAPIDLAARRRRRVARNVLVAAAAIVVLGVGISRVDLSGQDADGGSADSGAASAPEAAAREGDAGGGDTDQDLERLIKGRPLVLSSEDFDRQVRRLSPDPRASLAELPLEEGYSDDAHKDLAADAPRPWCYDAAWGVGQRIAVRYDGQRGVLVLRPPSGDSRTADLYLCGETVPTRSTTVPAG
ncbi:hypothetical protein GCM10023350_36280 [Nocardioides endophyticus]|uniref:Anti-sigma factor n=1 Tax=Nocardioides endophyticus TaxID=1353775 RepID=A0ABP8Z778_9ACTN